MLFMDTSFLHTLVLICHQFLICTNHRFCTTEWLPSLLFPPAFVLLTIPKSGTLTSSLLNCILFSSDPFSSLSGPIFLLCLRALHEAIATSLSTLKEENVEMEDEWSVKENLRPLRISSTCWNQMLFCKWYGRILIFWSLQSSHLISKTGRNILRRVPDR